MKIKAVISDFDGTLAYEGKYSPETRVLIGKIREKGIEFSLATGRLYHGPIENTIKTLNINGLHIAHNGAMIYDSVNEKKLWFQAMSQASYEKISRYLKDENVFFAIETENNTYMYPEIKDISHMFNGTPKLVGDHIDEPVLKVVVFAKLNGYPEPVMDRHIKNIQKLATDIEIIKFNFEGNFGVDITSEKATKHTAVLEYIKMQGFKKEEVAAMGDSYNDYPLLTAVGFKIVMGQAHKELKEIADLVVAPIKEGGTEEALKYILDNLI